MGKLITTLSILISLSLTGSAAAQDGEYFDSLNSKKFGSGCGRRVSETSLDKDGKHVDYPYFIQRNCLKAPLFSEKEKTEVIKRRYKGYQIEIRTFDRMSNNTNDIMVFQIRNKEGKLIENTLYEASKVTGKISNKLMDLLDLKADKLGCDETYDFKSLGLPPSKKNPMQREVGHDLEKLCQHLFKRKAKNIINQDIKNSKRRPK